MVGNRQVYGVDADLIAATQPVELTMRECRIDFAAGCHGAARTKGKILRVQVFLLLLVVQLAYQ